VLIAAIRGNSAISEVARSYLFEPLRDYIIRDYVAVELIPKAAYHGNHAESKFYQDFFDRATARVPSSDAGLDAVHVACAVVGEAARTDPQVSGTT
jgi:hypothetical protein